MKNLVTFKRWVGVKEEKVYNYGGFIEKSNF